MLKVRLKVAEEWKAIQYTGDNLEDVERFLFDWAYHYKGHYILNEYLVIESTEGDDMLTTGDWLVIEHSGAIHKYSVEGFKLIFDVI
jgi:hypothetical protein